MNAELPEPPAQPRVAESIDLAATSPDHELSNILTTVIGYTELCLDESQKGTLLHGHLSRVLGAAKRATDLIHEILSLGLLEKQGSGLATPGPRAEKELPPTGTECIFLVGAEFAIIEMQQLLLESLGYKVVIRTNSMEALEVFRHNMDKFDAVIADLDIPDFAGDQLALEVKKIRPDIPVLLSAGPARTSHAGRKRIHADGFLTKPLGRTEMAKALRSALDRSRDSALAYLYRA